MRTRRTETQLAGPLAREVSNRGLLDKSGERETHRLTNFPSDL